MRQFGNKDNSISPYLKARIIQNRQGIITTVVGVIGEGSSKEVVSNWQSPFEGESLGGHFQKIGGIIKVTTGTDITTKSSLASEQVWQGNQPHSFNLSLSFYALNDPVNEVEEAIKALEKMMLPELNLTGLGYSTETLGRDPDVVTVKIGEKQVQTDCVLTNLSVPLDGRRTKDGHLVRADVSLMIETKQMLNYSAII
ncbi:MAG TPA: hypothetical protein ENN86_02515 [Desulfobacteraceae bacterium]|nr:hypothetical protein [Desulfobacteraceae bacterium]